MATQGCWAEPMDHGRPASSGSVSDNSAELTTHLSIRDTGQKILGSRDGGQLALALSASHDKRIETLD